MTRKEIFQWTKKQYGTNPDYPWQDRNAVLRHRENKKWYGLIMEVRSDRLGMAGDRILCIPCICQYLRQFLPERFWFQKFRLTAKRQEAGEKILFISVIRLEQQPSVRLFFEALRSEFFHQPPFAFRFKQCLYLNDSRKNALVAQVHALAASPFDE